MLRRNPNRNTKPERPRRVKVLALNEPRFPRVRLGKARTWQREKCTLRGTVASSAGKTPAINGPT